MGKKLIDILVDHLDEWPFVGGQITQDIYGNCFWTKKQRKYITYEDGFWVSEEDRGHGSSWRILANLPLASDWGTAIITEEMWRKAKNPPLSSPPYAVGEIIEAKIGRDEWVEVRVIGWGKHGEDDCITFCELLRGEDSKLHVSIYTGYEYNFRAKNSSKSKLIEKVVKVLSNCGIPLLGKGELTMVAHSLYDNDLLKKEEECEGLD